MKSYIPHGFVLEANGPIDFESLKSKRSFQVISESALYFTEKPNPNNIELTSDFKILPYKEYFSDSINNCIEMQFHQLDSYLGDYEVGEKVSLDLRLKDNNSSNDYELKGLENAELEFKNGILLGEIKSVKGLNRLGLKIKNKKDNKTLERSFYLRSYEGVCTRQSFVENNYIHLGYGSKMLEYNKRLPFIRKIDEPLSGEVQGSPFEHAKGLARKLYQKAQELKKDVILFGSGGIDSQCMIQSFLSAQIPCRIIFMRDVSGVNDGDYQSFLKFAQTFNLEYEIQDMDFCEFINSYQYLSMALKYRFNNPEYGLLLQLMDSYDGFYVYAGRPCSVNQSQAGHRVLGIAVDETWSKARYLEREGKYGCTEFLSGSLSLLKSFLYQPILVQLDEKNERWYYKHKVELLKMSGFETVYAPQTKFTGFEPLKVKMLERGFGDIWIKHRFPLKLLFENPCCRATNRLDPAGTGQLGFKQYPDGFSWSYLQKENIKDFH